MASLAACFNPRQSDAFVWDVASFPIENTSHVAWLYLPNRVFDVLDLVHFGAGVGPAIGIEMQATRFARFRWSRGATVGLGWFGRYGQTLQIATFDRYPGFDDEDELTKTAWWTPKYDVSIQLHALVGHVYVGIAPFDELVDLILGFTTYDLKGDDW